MMIFAAFAFVAILMYDGMSVMAGWGLFEGVYQLHESILLTICCIIRAVCLLMFIFLREDKYNCNTKIEYQGKTYLF